MAKNSKFNIIHKSPLLTWLIEEQPCDGRTLAEKAGINEATWSKLVNGRADTTTETFWRIAKVVAEEYPSGSVARVVKIIEARAEGVRPPNLGEQMALLIESADKDELEMVARQIIDVSAGDLQEKIFLLLGEKIFKKPLERTKEKSLESIFR